MKHSIIDMTIIVVFLVAICTVGCTDSISQFDKDIAEINADIQKNLKLLDSINNDLAELGKITTPSKSTPNCYATCHQFESALLVGCYLADRDPSKTKKEHEDYCKKLAKELMGKDSGCKK